MAAATSPVGETPPHGVEVVEVDEEDKSTFSYREIANLLLIGANPVFQAALNEWDRKEKDLGIRVDRREKQSADLKNEIYNIVGWFAVFQGVVLTAVSQLAASQTSGSTPLCGKVWSPILLTGFGTIITCVGVVLKFLGIRTLEHAIQFEKRAQAEASYRKLLLRRRGPMNFRFRTDAPNFTFNRKKSRTFWKNLFFAFFPLLSFTTVFILSYFVILCDVGVIRGWND